VLVIAGLIQVSSRPAVEKAYGLRIRKRGGKLLEIICRHV